MTLFNLAIEVINEPEQTKLSLFANAICTPFFIDATTGISPADPEIAAITKSVLKSKISSYESCPFTTFKFLSLFNSLNLLNESELFKEIILGLKQSTCSRSFL